MNTDEVATAYSRHRDSRGPRASLLLRGLNGMRNGAVSPDKLLLLNSLSKRKVSGLCVRHRHHGSKRSVCPAASGAIKVGLQKYLGLD